MFVTKPFITDRKIRFRVRERPGLGEAGLKRKDL